MVKLSKEHEDKPGFKEARDKAFGGPTTVKGSISTVTKPSKDKDKSPPTKLDIGSIAGIVGKGAEGVSEGKSGAKFRSPVKKAGIFGRTNEGTWERTTKEGADSGKYTGTEFTGKDIPRSKQYKEAEKRGNKKSLAEMNKATHATKVVDKATGETIGSKEDRKRQAGLKK